MTHGNFLTLKDYNTSNALWNEEEVYLLATLFNIGGESLITPNTKTFQDISLISDDESSYLNNYNRRKADVSYSGYNNPIITITCKYNPTKIGNTATINGATRKMFTPSKLYELIVKPRTVYLQDEFLIKELLVADQDGSPAIYSERGIPVVLKSWKLTPSIQDKEVLINLTFIEDQEV